MDEKKSCCCSCCTPTVTIVTLIVVGVIVACLGAAGIPLMEDLYEKTVKTNMVMKKDSEAYNNWLNPPAPVYMQYYIYNYTNHEDVVKNNAKPNVTQLGPFTYREARINAIIDVNEYNITYLQNYSYIFDASMSCAMCSEDVIIFTPNTAILAIAKKIHDLNITKDSSFFKRVGVEGVNIILNGRSAWTLFKKLSVKQLLWGYNEPFLETIDEIESILAKIGVNLPKISPFVALQQNGTKEALLIGNLTLVTGKEDVNQVQHIVKWRGLDKAPFWMTKYGEMINGSDGTHARPFTKREDTIYVFTAELCRSLYFEYLADRTLMDIDLYRFHTTSYLFANHTVNPDNAAFCNAEKCWGSGLLPVGQCQDGNPPVFMSAPHFYQGDESLWKAIDGLHPKESLHATYLDVEPITGITMEAHKKLQINILVQKDVFLTILQHLPNDDNFLPVLWVHELAKIDKKSADKFKSEVLLPKQILKFTPYGLFALGGILVLLALVVGVVKKNRQVPYSELNVQDQEPKVL